MQRITPHSRIGRQAPSVRQMIMKQDRGREFKRGSIFGRTHPHHLTASRPVLADLKVVGRREYLERYMKERSEIYKNLKGAKT